MQEKLNIPPADGAWLFRQALLMALLALLLLGLFENTALDLRIQDYFYDPQLGKFPLRNHWLFELVFHRGLKLACYALLFFATGICLLGLRGRFDWLPRRHAWLALAGMLLIPTSIALFKQYTQRHCPWDIVDFGGYAPYVGLLDSAPRDIARGYCFPAGHAAGGLAWIVWAIALRATRPRLAQRILIGSLALGMLMGLSRMAQGAHFLSHTLWSAWWAWALSLALAAAILLPGARRTTATAPAASHP